MCVNAQPLGCISDIVLLDCGHRDLLPAEDSAVKELHPVLGFRCAERCGLLGHRLHSDVLPSVGCDFSEPLHATAFSRIGILLVSMFRQKSSTYTGTRWVS